MPRVQVANMLHKGRARASHSLHASLQTVDKPHCNGRGFAHTRPTILCIHLVLVCLFFVVFFYQGCICMCLQDMHRSSDYIVTVTMQ